MTERVNCGFQFLKSLLRTTSCLCILFPSRKIFSIYFNILTKAFHCLLILLFYLENEAFLFAFLIITFNHASLNTYLESSQKGPVLEFSLKQTDSESLRLNPGHNPGALETSPWFLRQSELRDCWFQSTHHSSPISNTLSSREIPGSFIFPQRLVAGSEVII